jgi:hypothetical protein
MMALLPYGEEWVQMGGTFLAKSLLRSPWIASIPAATNGAAVAQW